MTRDITIRSARAAIPCHLTSSTTCQFTTSNTTAASVMANPARPTTRPPVQAANFGKNRRTAMPASSGRKNDSPRTSAVFSGARRGSRGNSGPSISSHSGTRITANTDETTTRLKIYAPSPMPSSLRGSRGAPAETASTSRPASAPAGNGSRTTNPTAASGTSTYMASRERNSSAGCRNRRTASCRVESRPMPKMTIVTVILRRTRRPMVMTEAYRTAGESSSTHASLPILALDMRPDQSAAGLLRGAPRTRHQFLLQRHCRSAQMDHDRAASAARAAWTVGRTRLGERIPCSVAAC